MGFATNTDQTNRNDRPARAARRGRITRGAAALVLAASGALGATAIGVADAGATTPLPDPFPSGPSGGWVLPPSLELLPPLPPFPVTPEPTIPDLGVIPVLPDFPLEPVFPPPAPPTPDGPTVSIPTGPAIGPDDLVPDGPVFEDGCLTIDCLEGLDSGDPGDPTPGDDPTPEGDPAPELTDLGYPDGEGLGYPDGEGITDPEPTPVRTESAEGVLAFTGSDAFLPIAGAGLLGAGGVLAGISVLARRARNGRS